MMAFDLWYTRCTTYANVRLDMKNEEEILYHQDINSLNASIWSHLPDPSLGYLDNSTGSDMFNVIRMFLNNTQYLCGSIILIAAKRYPNETELDDLIAELRQNHVFVYITATDSPSGGNSPFAMVDVSTKTNGYCVFSDNETFHYALYFTSDASYTNQIVAQKFLVSGTGHQTVSFKVYDGYQSQQYVYFHIIFQDHKVDGSLKNLNYTVTDEFGGSRLEGNSILIRYTEFYNLLEVNDTVNYFLTVNYEYEIGRQEVMEIRMYSSRYIPDNWLPFDN